MLARATTRARQAVRVAACENPLHALPLRQAFIWNNSGPSPPTQYRLSSTTSSTRWKARQTRDTFARDAKVAGLKSRAAYKLLEINDKHRLFKPGDTVVDLGYAPGSWSQVAVNRTQPGGRVVGIDVIPSQPPKGVSTLQGDFLSPGIREEVRKFVADPKSGRPKARREFVDQTEEHLDEEGKSLLEETQGTLNGKEHNFPGKAPSALSQKQLDERDGRVVNVVLSDMCEPWPLVASTWVKSVSNPYRRMMNTSGMAFRDHAGSMVSESSRSKPSISSTNA